MSRPAPLFPRAFLLGTGLIGGSLALDLKARGLVGEVLGHDRDPAAEAEAVRRGILDRAAPPAEGVLSSCQLVVLAVPVLAMADLLRGGLPHGPLVTDVGSVKAPLVEAWRESVRRGRPFRFVPGHPIAGDERSGPGAARSGLFEGARVILTPPPSSAEDAEAVAALWRGVGARVESMDADRHDEIFAWVSHLPHLAAYALIHALLDRPENWIPFCGGGLRDYTRIAASSPAMWADIAFANRGHLLEALSGFGRSLGEIRRALEAGDRGALESAFERAAMLRRGL